MKIKKDEFIANMAKHDMSFSEVAKAMQISRSYLWEVLEGKKGAGSKFITGLKKVFPDEQLENFFII